MKKDVLRDADYWYNFDRDIFSDGVKRELERVLG
jgi:hypothetical protein